MQLRVHGRMDEIPETAWQALLGRSPHPFVSYAWLDALERSGCVAPETGWQPAHLTLWRAGTLVAAAPAYLRRDSDGDFSRDWGWASALERAGVPYYPKLALTVPFTPVTGPRLLTAAGPGDERRACIDALLEGARALCREAGASSIQVLFPAADEASELAAAGLARRIDLQYHWRNRDYADAEAFLQRFDSKRRNAARRERAAPAKQGIALRTVRGEELARDRAFWAPAVFELHRSTVDKMAWGRRWLNRAFYEQVFERMPEALEVVEARRAGELVAGAFNVATPTHLYGRYWGCFEEHPFLHFNVCLYHSIDECIRRGVQVFEGGAGGEHKLQRGFEPAETYSAHLFLEGRVDRSLRAYIAGEANERQAAVERWRQTSPILKKKPMNENEP